MWIKTLMKTVKIQSIEIPKIFKEMKIKYNKEIESLAKIQTEIKLDVKNSGYQRKTSVINPLVSPHQGIFLQLMVSSTEIHN